MSTQTPMMIGWRHAAHGRPNQRSFQSGASWGWQLTERQSVIDGAAD